MTIYGPASSHRDYQSDARLAIGLGVDAIYLSKVDLLLRSLLPRHANLGRGTRCVGFDLGTSEHVAGLRGQAHCHFVSRFSEPGGSLAAVAEDRCRLDQKVCARPRLDRRRASRQRQVPRSPRRGQCEGQQAAAVAAAHGAGDVAHGVHPGSSRRQGRRLDRPQVLLEIVEAARRGRYSRGLTGAAK
jgi:hypothetical protein